jgi:signal transduction histidine kinase
MSKQTLAVSVANPTPKTLILHVDDDPTFLALSKEILQETGNFQIETATSVAEAHQKLAQHPFQAIISDYEMPTKNGLQFLEELRQQKNEIAFVMFTGRGREEVAVRALNLGADRYINKVGDPQTVYCELSYALTKIVERKKARRMLLDDAKKISELNEKLQVIGSLTRHDIRNRLFALNAHVYQLKKRLTQDPQAIEHLNGIELVSQQIVELLEFAHVYEKIGVEELTSITVEQCVADAVDLFRDLKGIKITNQCRGLCVLADSLLRQLIYNLIDNTLKHGVHATQIRIYYQSSDAVIKLIYEDNGVGISESQRETIFAEKTVGVLHHSLYVARRICETYGWKIQETGQNRQGAQFTLTIPACNTNMRPIS